MKLTKKLIPAIGMLMLSAVMLVTSSFAWFSMNETVKVSSMKVTAKGDQVYLQIVDDTDDFAPGSALTSVDYATDGITKLLPVNVADSLTGTTKSAYKGGSEFKWVKAIGTAPNNSTAVDAKYSEVNGAGYFLQKTLYVRLDETAGAVTAAGALRVQSVEMTNYGTDDFAKCVSVLAVTDGYSQLYKQTAALGTFNLVSDADGEKSNEALSAGKYTTPDAGWTQVDIYVFFDGDNAACTLDGLANAKNNATGYGITVTFTVAELS